MKRLLVYSLTALAILLIGFFLLLNRFVFKDSDPLMSPLQSFLNRSNNSQVSTIDLWIPNLIDALISDEAPVISAKSALVYDLTENKPLFEKIQTRGFLWPL